MLIVTRAACVPADPDPAGRDADLIPHADLRRVPGAPSAGDFLMSGADDHPGARVRLQPLAGREPVPRGR
ncbi:hypothetical protein QJS66_13695 [Kocuria rhizophila]|nr:hypothetical protein QJS66_13695 [Kocuria rhizophila]